MGADESAAHEAGCLVLHHLPSARSTFTLRSFTFTSAPFTFTSSAQLDLGPIEDAGASVVIADKSCSHVIDVPKAGGEPILRSVADQPLVGGSVGLEADDQSFYCSNGAKIFAISRGDGSVRELAGDQSYAKRGGSRFTIVLTDV